MYTVLRFQRLTPLGEKLPPSKVHFEVSLFTPSDRKYTIFIQSSCYGSVLRKLFDIDINVNDLLCFIDVDKLLAYFAYRFQNTIVMDEHFIKPLKLIDLRSPLSKVLLSAVYNKQCRVSSLDKCVDLINDYLGVTYQKEKQIELNFDTPF